MDGGGRFSVDNGWLPRYDVLCLIEQYRGCLRDNILVDLGVERHLNGVRCLVDSLDGHHSEMFPFPCIDLSRRSVSIGGGLPV